MNFSLMKSGQESVVIDIVKEVFDEILAPGYTQEGINEFYNFANVENLSERSKTNHFTILAQDKENILGIIEIRDLSHVSLFFVRTKFQNKGIGKALFHEAVKQITNKNQNIEELTVNSSINAVPAYKGIGFIAQSGKKCFNGIYFVPMKLKINS